MGGSNYCHRGSKFAPSERGQTLTGLELQEYTISMNDNNFNDAISENVSHRTKARNWSEIDWKTAYEYVNRLQIRIVKATEGKKMESYKKITAFTNQLVLCESSGSQESNLKQREEYARCRQ